MSKTSLVTPCFILKVGFIGTLTLKALITTAADDIQNFFSLFFRENKT